MLSPIFYHCLQIQTMNTNKIKSKIDKFKVRNLQSKDWLEIYEITASEHEHVS
jgi:hypothetical protein